MLMPADTQLPGAPSASVEVSAASTMQEFSPGMPIAAARAPSHTSAPTNRGRRTGPRSNRFVSLYRSHAVISDTLYRTGSVSAAAQPCSISSGVSRQADTKTVVGSGDDKKSESSASDMAPRKVAVSAVNRGIKHFRRPFTD